MTSVSAGRRSLLAAGVAIAGPVIATLVAIALPGSGSTSAASLYMLGVVAAAFAGGMWTGAAAAVLSFLGLNFFFTRPIHTLKVRHAADLVALGVFLAVAGVVAALVARVRDERRRAERSTAEATSLATFTGRLLADEPLDATLAVAVRSLGQLFGLRACALTATVGGEPIDVRAGETRKDGNGAHEVRLPLEAATHRFGTLVAARDVEFTSSERTSLEGFAAQVALALQRARYDLEVRRARVDAETSGIRAALFSSITHDLRTPLASITAGVSGALDPTVAVDPAEREELLRTSLEEANRLNRLVGNLLDLARMRAGALVPAAELMPVEEVVESVLARMGPSLRGWRVRTFLRPALPLVSIDPIQLDQVLTNLIENAVRFSAPGTEIRVSVNEWDGSVEVRVADDGPGIPEEERERVFEPFAKRDAGAGRGGTGLGLAIARAVVLAHGGRIWIEGTPAGGTAVAFRLPVPKQPAPAETPAGGRSELG